jgi:malate dehydrogenase
MKIGFVGAGRVGSLSAFSTLHLADVDEISIVDILEDLAVGEAMDIETAASAIGKDVVIDGGSDYSLLKNSQIIVITAGVARKPGMTRLDLTKTNVKIMGDVMKNLEKHAKDGILIVVSNPVDVLVYHAFKISEFPREKILGMGSFHDTVRLVHQLKMERAGKTIMIGEHGDTMFPLEKIPGVNWEEIISRVRARGMEIIKRKGATTYTPAVCTALMVKAIVNDENCELPVSVVLDGEYGLKNVAMGVPCIIGKNGLVKIKEYELGQEEKESLIKSSELLKSVLKQVGW